VRQAQDKKKAIFKALCVLASIPLGYMLIWGILTLPSKWNEKQAKQLRARFCERLLADDRDGAMRLIPPSVLGHERLKRFVDFTQRVTACGDWGPPDPGSPGPGCINWQQHVLVAFPAPANDARETSDGTITFLYSCNSLAQWVTLVAASPRVYKYTVQNGMKLTRTGWDDLDR